jgi:glycosyltransferase involved in cell wall biosynthesis
VEHTYRSSVRYHYQENKGLGAARNTGISLAQGEFIQFLDADDHIAPEKFEKQLEGFKDPEISVVYSDYDFVTESGKTIEGAAERLKMESYEDDTNILYRLMQECVLIVHSTLIRASVLALEGGFDENRRISEDWDLWLRLASQGHKFKYVPGVFAHYVKHGNAMSDNFELLHERRLLLFQKFLADEGFKRIGKQNVAGFCAYQYRALADDCWNFKQWADVRRYLRQSMSHKSGLTFGDLSMYFKTFVHQISERNVSAH